MVSNSQKLLVIFGLKREYDTFSPTKNFQKTYGFAKKALISLRGINLSEIDTVINIGFCGAIDSSVKSGDIIKIKNIMDENGRKIKCVSSNSNGIINKIDKLNLKELDLITTLRVKNFKEKTDLKKKYSNVSLVDMEAFHLIQELKKKKKNFYSIKIVYDDLSFEIPTIFQNFLNDDGEIIFSKDFLITIFKNPNLFIEFINMGKKYFFCKRKLRYLFKKIFC